MGGGFTLEHLVIAYGVGVAVGMGLRPGLDVAKLTHRRLSKKTLPAS